MQIARCLIRLGQCLMNVAQHFEGGVSQRKLDTDAKEGVYDDVSAGDHVAQDAVVPIPFGVDHKEACVLHCLEIRVIVFSRLQQIKSHQSAALLGNDAPSDQTVAAIV